VPQELECNLGVAHYGFNQQYSNLFLHVQEDLLEIIGLQNPETSTPASRREMRLTHEEAHFDEDYYM
jgi:hypothetical protein